MKKTSKYMLVTGIAVVSNVVFISNTANASIRSRLSRFLANLCGSCLSRRQHPATNNLEVPSRLENKLNKLAYKKPVSGATVEGFNSSKIENIDGEKFYHQNKLGSREITLVSDIKPVVTDVKNKKVRVVFETPDGLGRNFTTKGVPIWLKGSDIKYQDKKKLESKLETYFKSVTKESPDGHFEVDDYLSETSFTSQPSNFDSFSVESSERVYGTPKLTRKYGKSKLTVENLNKHNQKIKLKKSDS